MAANSSFHSILIPKQGDIYYIHLKAEAKDELSDLLTIALNKRYVADL